jgi:hypothetical protein
MSGPFYETDTITRSYADVRSNTRSCKRGRDAYHKHSKFVTVKRGQRTLPHLESLDSPWVIWPADLTDCKVKTLSPREFWKKGREAVRCNHHQACPDKRHKWQKNWMELKRGGIEARRTARVWQNTGGEPRFSTLHQHAWTVGCDYLENSVDSAFFEEPLEPSSLLEANQSFVEGLLDALAPAEVDDDNTESVMSVPTDDFVYIDDMDGWDSDEDFVLLDCDDNAEFD